MVSASPRTVSPAVLLAAGLLALCGCGGRSKVTGDAPAALNQVVREYVEAVARGDDSHENLELSEAGAELMSYSRTSLNLSSGVGIATIDVSEWIDQGPGPNASLKPLTFSVDWGGQISSNVVFIVLTVKIDLDDGSSREGTLCLRPENVEAFTEDARAGPNSDWRVVPSER